MRKFTPFSDELYDYMLRQRSGANDPLMDRLRAETAKLGDIAQMSISPDQCSFLTFLVAAIGAKSAAEVGTFTGSSSLAIARALPPDGRLVCFDQAADWTAIAKRYWKEAGVADKIDFRLGDAKYLLSLFKPAMQLDFVFIDANKEGYDDYYEALLPHVRRGGLIVFDNMLRHGEVLQPQEQQTIETRAIDALNQKLAADPRVQSVLIPIADGLNLCRKL
jgi:caffeoyl-CoA O-methyltransferase